MSYEHLKHATEMDPATLENLMKEYGQEVWNFAYLITKNRTMADDITQDVFLQAYRHAASFRGEASVKTWLMRITRNRSYNYRKSAFFRKVLLLDLVPPNGHQRSAEQTFIEQETANHVWRQVLRLPRKYREVVVLHANRQLSHQEIASVLGIPEGTVKSRLSGARKRMAALLEEELRYEIV
ncbi:RNA polymerase sigma factor [Paenibacillus silvisoli]|uniref:RNA polymerase sigma factor n=1 Tax=Paenibacillus silvisoli TaxID=3110539 RepID=UPI002805510B|nr:sigma-70 family RNA polymerase sigma factor [Paenibacillus silvisoli]